MRSKGIAVAATGKGLGHLHATGKDGIKRKQEACQGEGRRNKKPQNLDKGGKKAVKRANEENKTNRRLSLLASFHGEGEGGVGDGRREEGGLRLGFGWFY